MSAARTLRTVGGLLLLGVLACGGNSPQAPVCPNTACPNPHSPGWGTDKTAAQFHGTEARRRTDCVTCHDQGWPGPLCVVCHRSLGFAGVTIHLPDFAATHSLADVAGNTLAPIGGGIWVACKACHP